LPFLQWLIQFAFFILKIDKCSEQLGYIYFVKKAIDKKYKYVL